jgi:5'-deoxynucleotidase YfbR-like HD superfamily hydrolase
MFMNKKKLKQMTDLVYEASVVKRLARTGWQIFGDNSEGVGEHSFITAVIAYFLAREISEKSASPERSRRVNMESVLLMSIFHDFHEGRTGELDKIAKFYTTRYERKANIDIFRENDPALLKLLDEYEDKESLEAKIVYEANVIAFSVEVKLLLEKGNTHAKEWLDANNKRLRLPESIALAKSLAATDSHNWWQTLRKAIHEEFMK